MKRITRLVFSVLLFWGLTQSAIAGQTSATFSRVHVWNSGDTLMSNDLNTEFNNILNNLNPQGIGAYGNTELDFQATKNPYVGGSPVLPTSLADEIASLRYQILKLTGQPYWYMPPTGSWNAPTIYSPTTTGTDSGVETLTNKSLTNPIISNTPLTFPSSTTQGGIYRDITGYSFVVPAGQSANVVSNAYYGNSSWRYIGTGIASLISASDTISGGNVCRAPSGTAGAPISWTCSPIATNNSVFGSQNVVTGSRALGTVYQNTTGKTMMVTVTLNVSGSTGTGGMAALTDSNSTPTTEVGQAVLGTNGYAQSTTLAFMVLPGNYYKISTNGSATMVLGYWTEWY